MTINDVALLTRETNTRESKEIYNVFELIEIRNTFVQAIGEIDNNLNYVSRLTENDKHLFKEEILRYQIVMLESAFDYFCHCLIKFGFVKIFRNEWNQTQKYKNFKVKFSQLEEAINNGIDENWILKMVDEKISSQTFLGYNELKDGFNYICEDLIKKVASLIYNKDESTNLTNLKNEIDYVYKRRNMIAHQNDREHKTGNKNNISELEVLRCKNIIKKIVEKTVEIIEKKTCCLEK